MGFNFNLHSTIRKTRKIRFLTLPVTLLFLIINVSGAEPEKSITVQGKDTTIELSHNDIKSGERLFYGLMRDQGDQKACISCHNIKPGEEMNWNPSAYEIAAAVEPKTLDDLMSALLTPAGKRLAASHAGYTALTVTELAQIKGFLHEYYEQGGYHQKPLVNRILIFLLLFILFVIALLDLIWFRIIRYRWIHTAVLMVSAVLLTKALVEESLAIGRSKNYMPDQPIKFSHAVHAGQNKIDCQYCHNSAEFGTSAGIPSLSVCLNCHMVVREGSRSGRFEINKIFAALDSRKPVVWNRVYKLPDHVFFSHAQHVGAGKIACQTCHGTVESMDRVTQVPDLSMGWCVNCHRDTKVQFHDNKFYEKYEKLHEDIKAGKIDSVTVNMVGGTDCMKCHY